MRIRGPIQAPEREGQESPMSDVVFDTGQWLRPARGDDAVSGGSLSVRRLREIETLLGVTIGPDDEAVPAPEGVPGSGSERGMDVERQALELLRAFNKIADPETRREVLRLVQAAARGDRN